MAKRIGILGGMTAESTVTYYQHITRTYQRRFGNHGYPEIVIYSVSFQQFEDWMEAGAWDQINEALLQGLERLQLAGAEFAVMATNTMHLLYDRLRARSPIPLVSIVDATADAIQKQGIACVGLLGTRFTMERSFYQDTLRERGISTIVPEAAEREDIHRVIMRELGSGVIRPESRRRYVEIIETLGRRGAEGIILGCTEIPLLVGPTDTALPLFDTTVLHAEAALNFALKQG